MKSPPEQYTDYEAHDRTADFISGADDNKPGKKSRKGHD
jgi:hypothetical protein